MWPPPRSPLFPYTTLFRSGGDGLRGELRRHIVVDRRQTKYLNVQLLSGRPHGFEVLAAVTLQTQDHGTSRHGLLQNVAVGAKLIADRRTNEVGAVRIEPFLHQQIDLSKIDVPEIDGDFFRLRFLAPRFDQSEFSHLPTIRMPSR